MTKSILAPPTFTGPELCRYPAHRIVDLLSKGEISANDLLDAAIERIRQVEPHVNAMPTVCEDRARAALSGIEALKRQHGQHPGWLNGVPIGIKDLNAVAGVRLTMGTLAFKDMIAEDSDPLVLRLEERGAIVVGKTNTPEMGAGGNTFNDVFGMTRNPWDTRKNAGGSSGGAAVSLATGEVWLSHGSDLGGSLRTPAAYCGVVGLRPSPGRAGGAPAQIAFHTEGVQGPMARSVRDCALFLDAMAGFDPRSPVSIASPTMPFQQAVRHVNSKVKIAYTPDLGGFAPVENNIDAVLRRALLKVQGLGATVDEACPDLTDLHATYVTLRAMLWAALPGRLPDAVQRHFKQSLRDNIALGKQLSADAIYDAQWKRSTLFFTMCDFLDRFDVLACPVVGLEAGRVEEEFPTKVAGQTMADYLDWLRFSFLATTTSLPALSVPAGFTESGMPVGLQLIGPPRGEAKLLAVAQLVEDAVDVTGSTPIDPRVAKST